MSRRRRSSSGAQTSKVYAAEREVFPLNTGPFTLAKAQRYCDSLLGQKWVIKRWGKRQVKVIDTCRTRGYAKTGWWGDSTISIPASGASEYLLVHELAHVLNRCQSNGHRWDFCATELLLVKNRFGKDKADELRAAYRRHKVRYTAPRTRKPLSPEQREANIARLAEARAKAALPKEIAPGFFWSKVEAGHYRLVTPEHGTFDFTRYDRRNPPIKANGKPFYGYVSSGAWVVVREGWAGHDLAWGKLAEVQEHFVEVCTKGCFSTWLGFLDGPREPRDWSSAERSYPHRWNGESWVLTMDDMAVVA